MDIVAHSMGGLLVKKDVAEHLTDHHINKAVFVGVPNIGAPKAAQGATLRRQLRYPLALRWRDAKDFRESAGRL